MHDGKIIFWGFILMLVLGFTMAVWDKAEDHGLEIFEEVELVIRPKRHFCTCAKKFGNLQKHIDCHNRRDI